MSCAGKVRVLVVDDSAVVRHAIVEALSRDPEIEVVGTACDPYVARDRILELNPDVLTLDIEMPRMDGLTFLRTLQLHHPLPVVVISSVTQAGSRTALEALEAGAVDVIAKPSSSWNTGHLRDQLAERVKGAARARVGNLRQAEQACGRACPTFGPVRGTGTPQLILIGASTGGTEAIKSVLTSLPGGLPGICIVQHIPPVFSTAFANRLNSICRFEVREASEGDEVGPGLALVAPGDYHMSVALEGSRFVAHLEQSPPLNFTRPAVDVLFNSAARWSAPGTVAVLLTGMGSDGAYGMHKLRQRGATTIVQDEATCVVFGMPGAAVKLGAADRILPLGKIPEAILAGLQRRPDEIRPAAVQS
jgi:two-component system, chemotaxis family, protein-glutamate methylesterase/glutaminase